MPIIESSSYQAPIYFRNAHVHTIYAGVFRSVPPASLSRERLELPDGDFLDLDWTKTDKSERLLIALHGLEGDAGRPYIQSLLQMANLQGWDAVGLNFRSCSGETNRLLRTYHSGVSDDLKAVVQHVRQQEKYTKIALVGFSLGGNVMLKYVGEEGAQIPSEIKAAVGVSVPVDLVNGSMEIAKWNNKLYVSNFLKSLKLKVKAKQALFPTAEIDWEAVYRSKNFIEFDGRYTAPVHGFDSAVDYWTRCSCLPLLPEVQIPTLLLNAIDDSFLGKKCYPIEIAKSSRYLNLEMPKYGGHVAFVDFQKPGFTWADHRILEFLGKVV